MLHLFTKAQETIELSEVLVRKGGYESDGKWHLGNDLQACCTAQWEATHADSWECENQSSPSTTKIHFLAFSSFQKPPTFPGSWPLCPVFKALHLSDHSSVVTSLWPTPLLPPSSTFKHPRDDIGSSWTSRIISIFSDQLISNLKSISTLIPLCHVT